MKTTQKDWIIADYKRGHLWCLAISSNDGGKNWYLIEWVNLSGVSSNKLHNAMMIGYKTMIEARATTNYSYVQGYYNFEPQDISNDYFKELLKGRKFTGKMSARYGAIKVNKTEWEKEVSKIFKKQDIVKSEDAEIYTEKELATNLHKSIYKSILKNLRKASKNKKNANKIIEDIEDANYIAEVDPDEVPAERPSIIRKDDKCSELKEKGVKKLKKFLKSKCNKEESIPGLMPIKV